MPPFRALRKTTVKKRESLAFPFFYRTALRKDLGLAPRAAVNRAPTKENSGNSPHNNSLSGKETSPLAPYANASDKTHTTANKSTPAASPGIRIPAPANRAQTAPEQTAAHAASKKTHGKISFSGSVLFTINTDNPISRMIQTNPPASVPAASALASGICTLSPFFRFGDIHSFLSRFSFCFFRYYDMQDFPEYARSLPF